MTIGPDLDIIQLTHPGEADPAVRQELTACWIAVTNAGGAAGFPFPPVNVSHVRPAVDALAARLDPSRSRILLARVGGALAGWVALGRRSSPLIAHWGVVSHLQTQLMHRNEGIGSALMRGSGKLPATRWAWSNSTWQPAAERDSKPFTAGSAGG